MGRGTGSPGGAEVPGVPGLGAALSDGGRGRLSPPGASGRESLRRAPAGSPLSGPPPRVSPSPNRTGRQGSPQDITLCSFGEIESEGAGMGVAESGDLSDGGAEQCQRRGSRPGPGEGAEPPEMENSESLVLGNQEIDPNDKCSGTARNTGWASVPGMRVTPMLFGKRRVNSRTQLRPPAHQQLSHCPG